jgi:hypothetical protein
MGASSMTTTEAQYSAFLASPSWQELCNFGPSISMHLLAVVEDFVFRRCPRFFFDIRIQRVQPTRAALFSSAWRPKACKQFRGQGGNRSIFGTICATCSRLERLSQFNSANGTVVWVACCAAVRIGILATTAGFGSTHTQDDACNQLT